MNKMNVPELEVVRFQSEDILTASVYESFGLAAFIVDPRSPFDLEGDFPAGTISLNGNLPDGITEIVMSGPIYGNTKVDIFRTLDGQLFITPCTGDHVGHDYKGDIGTVQQLVEIAKAPSGK